MLSFCVTLIKRLARKVERVSGIGQLGKDEEKRNSINNREPLKASMAIVIIESGTIGANNGLGVSSQVISRFLSNLEEAEITTHI